MDFKQELITLLRTITQLKEEEVSNLLSTPPDHKLGDYAFPCFKLGKNPREEAEKLKEKFTKSTLPNFIGKIEVAGPYLNFFLNQSILAAAVLKKIYQEQKFYGKQKIKAQRIVVEYCGPNTNKPLHLGHLRNISLGNSLVRILSFQGHKVSPVNIVNDRGIHICQSMLAYQKWGQNKEPDKKGDHFVGDYYVLFAKQVKDNPELKEEARELLVKWEQGDKGTLALWKKMNKWVLDGFEETYQRFGIKFDKDYFESAYYDLAKEMVQEGLKTKKFKQDDTGAVIAPLEKYNLPDKVLLRRDDTSIYITQDLYLSALRYRDFKFDQMIYVVASEQRLHFQQLFKILELMGKKYASNMHHLSYGLVHLPSGRMKSREGNVVDADDIMDEVAELARKEIESRHSNILESEIKSRAENIALSAIKFFMLKTDPVKDIVFNPEESMSFEGETGPYVQYTHARACSILRKSGLKILVNINYPEFNSAEELNLIKLLAQFKEVIEQSAVNQKPHHLAQYLISLSQAFNEFYHKLPVISEDKDLMKARLLLVDSVRKVLANGLNLLGITALEEM